MFEFTEKPTCTAVDVIYPCTFAEGSGRTHPFFPAKAALAEVPTHHLQVERRALPVVVHA